MQTTSPTQFDELLASVDLEVRGTRRQRLTGGSCFVPEHGLTTLVYVTDGELRLTRPMSCMVGGAQPGAAPQQLESIHTLPAGSALLTLGRSGVGFEATADVGVLEMTLEFTDLGGRLERLLPDPVAMTDFSALEPAAAALAREMGSAVGDEDGRSALPVRIGDGIVCKLMAQTLVLGVLRSWLAAGCAPRDLTARVADAQLERVLRAIHEEPGAEWTLDTLAGIAAMSRAVFARRFRELLGETPGQYVAGVRMAGAKRLLATGESVSRTSRELGYSSDEGFSRAFRRHTGVQPSRWRESQLAS